ncbi:MAG: asparagine synthase [Gammaproteobacteria bacterium]|nr:asparagine synthase [Gammaproteobacteria bacterium]MCP5299522.1 asparagine synthase [Chromatiaceae bacterium]
MVIPGISGRISAQGVLSTATPPDQAVAADMRAGDTRHLVAEGLSAMAVRGWCASADGVHCAIAGNVDWLAVELADSQLRHDPAVAVLQAYRQHGTGLLSVIGGRFAVCVWDTRNRTGLVAVDHFGQVPVYWGYSDDGELLFAPLATSIDVLAGRPHSVSPQAVFNYLYFHMVPSPATVFEGTNKLMAAHALFCESGRWEVRRYWEPEFRETADRPMREMGEELMGLLGSSVARLDNGEDTGAFLSGGLDSSTVAGLLARHRPDPNTYSIGFDADGYDEIAFARIASERFRTRFNTYYVTPDDVLSELPRIAAAYDEPFGNSSALPAYFCARFAAADGRRRLLAGDGGDELFAGNERYAKQRVFEHYPALPAWLRRTVIEPVLGRMPDNATLVRKALSYVQQANIPLPDRLQTYNFLNRLGAEQIVTDDLRQAIDSELPLRLDREIYHQPRNASSLNRMLYLDWHHTLADNDLRKVNRMCDLAGIQVEYPMLDDRLVEFSTRVSSTNKMRGNKLRAFYKRAVTGFLPDEIINKPKHGFGLPFGVWMTNHPGLQQLVADNLARMKRRNYVRPEFIDEISRLHREQHAGYYGEFIWVLMMLELWLTHRGIEP